VERASRRFIAAIVAAQVLTQIGTFILPALLPEYIDRWDLSKTEAGWLIGIFFAGYVVVVPVLVALTDRVPAGCRPDARSCGQRRRAWLGARVWPLGGRHADGAGRVALAWADDAYQIAMVLTHTACRDNWCIAMRLGA
jgi:MFS family permease